MLHHILAMPTPQEDIAFVALLRACAKHKDLFRGHRVHAHVLKTGLLDKNCYVANTLVSMYAKCGALDKARQVLEELPIQNVVSWSALIAGFAQQGHGHNALSCFERMQLENLSPDAVTYISILKACGSIRAADKGEQIHDDIVRHGLLGKEIALGNALVSMYVKCGALAKAHRVLDELPIRDVVSWSTLIAGYAQHGQGQDALNCFERMQQEGLSPNNVTFISILKACGSIGAVGKGEQVYDEIARQGLLGKDVVLGNALVDMYAKCGALMKARQVLEELPIRDVVSWSALIAGYVEQGQGENALECFERMQRDGLSPNAVTFVCVLKACGSIGVADKGEQIHDEIVKQGLLEKDIVLGNALVDMYAKCGALTKAARVLEELPVRDVVSWSTLIAGYVQHEQSWDALNCFEQMQGEGLSPDAVTFICILKACSSTGIVDKGKQVHDEISRQGLLSNNNFLGTALVDMYAKCGAVAKAQQVLEGLPVWDVAPWNALISAFVQQRRGEEALNCYARMQRKGLSPGEVTFTCILKACGTIGAADKGKQIHNAILRQGLLKNNVVLGTALVDMYVKCGTLTKAQQLLNELPVGNVVSWSALISGYAAHGQCEDALNCFQWMQCKGLSPNGVTFSSVLNACSHAGLLYEGYMHFASMSFTYGITPDLEHYTCMVDLLGRAGHLDKAVAVIQRMTSSDYPAIWSALMGACRIWGDVNVGRWAFEHAIKIEENDAVYLCMYYIYTAAGMHEDAENIEAMRMMKRRQDVVCGMTGGRSQDVVCGMTGGRSQDVVG